jgi:amidohydrolase
MNGAKYKLNYVPYFMPLSNNEELVDKFKVSALKIIPKENFIIDKGYKMVGEDFSFLNYQIPSIFFMAGVHKKGTPTYSLHNSNFIFEEESLFNYATPILIQFALDLLA